MNYPIWDLPTLGGGTLIALVSILHVYIAHLAVGGGLFLVITEIRAIRNNDTQLLGYVKRHTRFFLLLTLVLGAVSGVGIWFTISLVSPAATSALIHQFVFGWAVEWVFFIAEIIAILIYHYRFDKMNSRDHIRIGWLYFLFAWLSLFIINGILSFMLTPGDWVNTQSFWDGFFNPGFLPSLLFRTGMAATIAGIFGLLTALFIRDRVFQRKLFRYCATWLYLPFVLTALSGLLYYFTVPDSQLQNLLSFNQGAQQFIHIFLISTIVIFTFGLILVLKSHRIVQSVATVLLIITGIAWLGGFEYLREIGRKPFVINEYMYSNSILKKDMNKIQDEGFLAHSKWTTIKEITTDNELLGGEEIFRHQCMACHTFGGRNDIVTLINSFTRRGLEAQLSGMGHVRTYMPPFGGNKKEAVAVSKFLYHTVLGRDEISQDVYTPKKSLTKVPKFDKNNDEYVLLAWNDLGMHCISDNDKYFSFLPPANTLFAQLFKRGEKPQLVQEGVTLTYEVEDGFKNPEKHVPFWEYDEIVYGADLKPGLGLAGKAVDGKMEPAEQNCFIAHFVPVVPYKDDGSYNPYPLFDIKAINDATGEILAHTRMVAPTSTEMGCRNCHGGGWRVNGISGISDETSENILALHDRYNETTLLADALAGKPHLCQECHSDPAIGAKGKPDVLNFSTSIHGFHANYLTGMDAASCRLCHPAKPGGNTDCLRGRHKVMGVSCVDCHGALEDHAHSLLAHEESQGKAAAKRLMQNLPHRFEGELTQINGRIPWLKEPDCLSCHTDFNIKQYSERPSAFNKWVAGGSALYRNRTDNHGVMCSACHGSTHAIYFGTNMYGTDRDNVQPVQYQNLSGSIGTKGNCDVCHTKQMNMNGHHRNMIKNNSMTRPPIQVEKLGENKEDAVNNENIPQEIYQDIATSQNYQKTTAAIVLLLIGGFPLIWLNRKMK